MLRVSDLGLWALSLRVYKCSQLNVDSILISPLPVIGIIIGILIFRPLKGGVLLIRGLHYRFLGSKGLIDICALLKMMYHVLLRTSGCTHRYEA